MLVLFLLSVCYNFHVISVGTSALLLVLLKRNKIVSGVMGNQPNPESDPVEERLRNQIEEEKKRYTFILQILFTHDPSKLQKPFSVNTTIF